MGAIVKPDQLPNGQVKVTPHGEGWYLIQIGRSRYTKRFNLSVNEALQLRELLVDLLPE